MAAKHEDDEPSRERAPFVEVFFANVVEQVVACRERHEYRSGAVLRRYPVRPIANRVTHITEKPPHIVENRGFLFIRGRGGRHRHFQFRHRWKVSTAKWSKFRERTCGSSPNVNTRARGTGVLK